MNLAEKCSDFCEHVISFIRHPFDYVESKIFSWGINQNERSELSFDERKIVYENKVNAYLKDIE